MIKQIYRFLNPKFQNIFLEYKVDIKSSYGQGKPAHQDLYKINDANRKACKKLLEKALSLKDFIWTIQYTKEEAVSKKLFWDNGFLERNSIN